MSDDHGWDTFVTEQEYVQRAGVPDLHCPSCHEDDELGYEGRSEVYGQTDPFMDGTEWTRVCCYVLNAVSERRFSPIHDPSQGGTE